MPLVVDSNLEIGIVHHLPSDFHFYRDIVGAARIELTFEDSIAEGVGVEPTRTQIQSLVTDAVTVTPQLFS